MIYVSLTTIPKRVKNLNKTIESLLRQSQVPDKIFVNVGDHVKKGEVIGTVGSSGRATGPHLDIRLNWYDTRLDPNSVLNIK